MIKLKSILLTGGENAPKTPKITGEVVIAVPKFDKPQENDNS
jgi:hypothetical protein